MDIFFFWDLFFSKVIVIIYGTWLEELKHPYYKEKKQERNDKNE